jgi:hypothetical protein
MASFTAWAPKSSPAMVRNGRSPAGVLMSVSKISTTILGSVGAGFDARLGEHWILGIGMNFASTWRAGVSLLDGGIHLGYGWGGATEE